MKRAPAIPRAGREAVFDKAEYSAHLDRISAGIRLLVPCVHEMLAAGLSHEEVHSVLNGAVEEIAAGLPKRRRSTVHQQIAIGED
jgi:hypothetical protein